MSYTQPYLRPQTRLLDDIRADGYTVALGYADVTVYRCINRTLATWQRRVLIPHLYTLPDGWVSGTYDYALPSYIRPPLIPQFLRTRPYSADFPTTGEQTWQDLSGWQESVDSNGSPVLRVTMRPYTVAGQVVWYAPNGRVPTAVPTTNAAMTDVETSLTLGSAVDCEDTGWVKIGDEWVAYAGLNAHGYYTTLNNLVRAQAGTDAAEHITSSDVTWGIAVDDLGLYEQLADQVKAYLHQSKVVNTSVHETGRHEQLMQYYQKRADDFWIGYASQRPSPRLVLDQRYLLR